MAERGCGESGCVGGNSCVSDMSIHEKLSQLDARLAPIFAKMVEARRANNGSFCDDTEHLWKDIRKEIDAFDKENPVDPCPVCGSKRLASLNGHCINHDGRCPLARPLGE